MEINSKKRKAYIIYSLLFSIPFISIVLIALFRIDYIHSVDNFITGPIIKERSTAATSFFIFVTRIGSLPIILMTIFLFSLYLIFLKKNYVIFSWFLLQIALGGILNKGLKFLFQRHRPLIRHLVVQGGFSFPRGHSMGSIICYGAIAFILFQQSKHLLGKLTISTFFAVLIFLIGISRIYLGVHYPTDIIGGYSAGAAWVAFAASFYPYWKNKIIHYIPKTIKKDGS